MNLFAKYYDRLVGADYKNMSDFIDTVIKKYKPDAELVCDLGCGTATIAIDLVRNGYDMIAIDSSDDMLSIAEEKLKNDGIDKLLLLNQDICEFELYGTVDVIYSTLDTLNYILDKRSLNKLFSLVKNYLNYDGLFIFDINTEYKFKMLLGNNTFVYDDENEFCVWETEYDAKNGKSSHLLTFFERNENGLYNRFEDYQQQRFYSEDYIYFLAKKYDFTILNTYDDYHFKNPTSKTERITYILKINK